MLTRDTTMSHATDPERDDTMRQRLLLFAGILVLVFLIVLAMGFAL